MEAVLVLVVALIVMSMSLLGTFVVTRASEALRKTRRANQRPLLPDARVFFRPLLIGLGIGVPVAAGLLVLAGHRAGWWIVVGVAILIAVIGWMVRH